MMHNNKTSVFVSLFGYTHSIQVRDESINEKIVYCVMMYTIC